MRRFKKVLTWIACVTAVLYVAVCTFFYSEQNEILFVPTKLAADYQFSFPGQFKELNVKTRDGFTLDGGLFKTDSAKGLIFYLHGNAGALSTWGEIAGIYTSLGYDLFILDYRGYGKSEAQITSEVQLFDDVQIAYDSLRKQYPENKIVILGYSIGTGPAAMLAAHNNPKMLILQAPYYSMKDMMEHTYPFLPTFMLNYPLNTDGFIKETKAPIVIFHGDGDEVIYYGSSVKLKKELKPGDTLITLNGQGHNGFTKNKQYLTDLEKVLK